jgi:hypothetical protein
MNTDDLQTDLLAATIFAAVGVDAIPGLALMELFANLAIGFDVAPSPSAMLYCLIGVTLGTFIGVLPGIGPLAASGALLPITMHAPSDRNYHHAGGCLLGHHLWWFDSGDPAQPAGHGGFGGGGHRGAPYGETGPRRFRAGDDRAIVLSLSGFAWRSPWWPVLPCRWHNSPCASSRQGMSRL